MKEEKCESDAGVSAGKMRGDVEANSELELKAKEQRTKIVFIMTNSVVIIN